MTASFSSSIHVFSPFLNGSLFSFDSVGSLLVIVYSLARPPRPGEPALPGSREPVLWAQAPRRRYPLCVPAPRGADSHSEAGCWVCCVQTAGAGKAETVPEE